jgi:hypothetical protein
MDVPPDPFGEPFGLPQLPLEPAAVSLTDTRANALQAPEQEVMPEAEAEPEMKASPGCAPCLPVPCGKVEAAVKEEIEAKVELGLHTPSIFSHLCANASQRVDETELLEQACWCFYCCCFGCGCGNFVHQRWLQRFACMKCECFEGEVLGEEGCCSCINTCCCVHVLAQVPPRKSIWMLCNEMYGGHKDDGRTEEQKKAEEEDSEKGEDVVHFMLEEAFTVCFCRYCGLTVNDPEVGSSHCSVGHCKCACCVCAYETTAKGCSDEHEGCCLTLFTCAWLYWHCRMPFENDETNPLLACMGCHVAHAHHAIYGPAGEDGPAGLHERPECEQG